MSMNVQTARSPIGQTGQSCPNTRSLKMQVNVGKGLEIAVDFSTMPQAAIDYCLYIGARNILMDSHAAVTADEYSDADERNLVALAMVNKKLAALMAGEVRVQSTREGDPVRAEAMRMAAAQITALIKKAGKKVADYDAKALRAKAAERITPELLAQAKARVDQLKATIPADETLADLGL